MLDDIFLGCEAFLRDIMKQTRRDCLNAWTCHLHLSLENWALGAGKSENPATNRVLLQQRIQMITIQALLV
ncbi:MAG: hypothetical protein ABWZ75_06775 [Novosphingobium sp.]